jgi:signal transduction histidine kinase
MRDRLAAVGGDVDVSSTPGVGTTVRGRVPTSPEEVTV